MESLPGYKQYNIVLDIDETFVHFIGKNEWDKLPQSEKNKYKTSGDSERQFFVFRPHVEEFFKFLFDTMKSVSLWTLSDAEYAKSVKKIIEKNWTDGRKILQVLAEDENEKAADDYGGNKNLHWLVDEYGNPFEKNNTILIDDHHPNTQHKTNKLNSIKIKAFAPFGLTKYSKEERAADATKLRNSEYVDMSDDDTLLKVIEVLKGVMEKSPSGNHVFDTPVAINATLDDQHTTATQDPSMKKYEALKACVKKAIDELQSCTSKGGRRRTFRKKRRTTRKSHH